VLTVAQVFELAERVGRRPVGNIRGSRGGSHRLGFRRDGLMRTAPKRPQDALIEPAAILADDPDAAVRTPGADTRFREPSSA
jgi:hypothetical protein